MLGIENRSQPGDANLALQNVGQAHSIRASVAQAAVADGVSRKPVTDWIVARKAGRQIGELHRLMLFMTDGFAVFRPSRSSSEG